MKAEPGIANAVFHQVSQIKEEGAKGTVQESRLFRLMNVDSQDGITFCLQHYFSDLTAYNQHIVTADSSFRAILTERFNDKLIVFASVLKEV